jgi:glycerol kinase
VNNLLVQFQADISAIEVIRPANLETTALGAAYLAGIAAGLWTISELNEKWRLDRSFHGTLQPQEIESLKQQWLKAVARAKNWVE